MAKTYGVICDCCRSKITSPGFHSIVQVKEQLINYVEKFDVCVECRGKIITFIKRIGETNGRTN